MVYGGRDSLIDQEGVIRLFGDDVLLLPACDGHL